VLVTKDSGGTYTSAKLEAARARSLPVIVVRRPDRPSTQRVSTVEEALAWATADSGHLAHPG
jgi:precorrin-6A/cobalt-precorrin-6A reductase